MGSTLKISAQIDPPDHAEVVQQVRTHGGVAAAGHVGSEHSDDREDGNQDDIDQWPGRNAPEICARSWRGLHKSNSTQWPENDSLGFAADGSAGEGVAEF